MKHRILLWVTVMFTGGTVVIGAWQTVAAQTMAFIDANVVTMDEGDVLEGQTVIVRDGVVVAIGPVDEHDGHPSIRSHAERSEDVGNKGAGASPMWHVPQLPNLT